MGYKNAPFQIEWYDFLQYQFSPLKYQLDKLKEALRLWPRGHAKTESTDINYVSWLVGNNPNIHVNLVSKTGGLVNNVLQALMTRFEHDARFIEVFDELKPKNPKQWSTGGVIVKRSEISKDPTIKATGLMGSQIGGRSDLIILDDIIDQENVTSSWQREKVVTWIDKVLMPTLYPWGAVIAIGTRWHYADFYSELIKKFNARSVQVLQAIKCEATKEVLWKDYWTYDRLIERRKAIGTIFFNCQYQNDPTSMQGDILKAEWLHEYQQLPTDLLMYAGVDPALGEGDHQAISTWGHSRSRKQLYLIDVWDDVVSFPEFLLQLRNSHMTHHYQKIFIESNAFQKVLTYLPELQGLPTVPTNTVANKEMRFIPMSSHFQADRVLVNPALKSPTHPFFAEWVEFPRGEHDDALDCVEIALRELLQDSDEDGFVIG